MAAAAVRRGAGTRVGPYSLWLYPLWLYSPWPYSPWLLPNPNPNPAPEQALGLGEVQRTDAAALGAAAPSWDL
eukprot:scaffold82207_cov36-Phaeocystis_antarctica.AAC.1